jgi:maltose alpha-D-glucosyltransferase/alpha-amylase
MANQGDAWSYTLDHLARVLDAYRLRPMEEAEAQSGHEVYLNLIRTLGCRTAELHLALAVAGSDPDFSPEPIGPDDLAGWREHLGREAHLTLERLEQALGTLPDDLIEEVKGLCARRDTVVRRLLDLVPETLEAVKIRHHGDYHLGEVLVAENDVIIIDFEGEPARPLAERRAKHSPFRDVAGMLRSFDYAAHAALDRAVADRPDDRPYLEPLVEDWERRTAYAFLEGYRETAAASSVFPFTEERAQELIRLFTLEKALYEVRYELDNRPTWVRIPLRGLLHQLAEHP